MSTNFKNNPPRVQLRRRDNEEGRNPTVFKSGIRTGKFNLAFDDTNTLIFTASDNVYYPQGLHPNTLTVASNFITSSFMTVSGTVRKSVADSLLEFKRETVGFAPFNETNIPTFVESDFFLTGSSEDEIFSERLGDKIAIKIPIYTKTDAILTRCAQRRLNVLNPSGRFSGSDYTGFSYYNFDEKRWEQIGLTDPETGAAILYDWAIPIGDDLNLDSTHILSGTNSFPSQFIAFDGEEISEDITTLSTSSEAYRKRKKIGSPTVTHFAPFANVYHATSSQTLKLKNYLNRPFLLEKVVVDLPIRAERRSNGTRLSSSINYSIPQDDYVFFMYRQERNYFPTGTNPQLGYVNDPTLTRYPHISNEYATGSMRYLICSGVMSFYNARTANISGSTYQVNTWEPVNTPAFSYDWNLGGATNPLASTNGQFTGSVRLNIPVAVTSPYMLNKFAFYRSNPAPSGPTGSHPERAFVVHYWPGGTTALPFGPGNITGKQRQGLFELSAGDFLVNWENAWVAQGAYQNYPQYGNQTFTWHQDATTEYSASFIDTKLKARIEKLDPRATRALGGDVKSFGTASQDQNQHSVYSPYLLLPEDELIFGLEAALGTSGFLSGTTYVTTSSVNTTGSLLVAAAGADAYVTLYGSYLRQGKPVDPGMPQFLTSEAISEAIGEDVYDEFLIPTREKLIGSMGDKMIYGDMYLTSSEESKLSVVTRGWRLSSNIFNQYVENSSQRISVSLLMTNLKRPPSASALDENTLTIPLERGKSRFTKVASQNERFYDTMTPKLRGYIRNLGGVRVTSYVVSASGGELLITDAETNLPGNFYKFPEGTTAAIGAHSGTYTIAGSTPILPVTGDIMPYPYKDNPKRYVVDNPAYLVLSYSNNSMLPYDANSDHSVDYREFVLNNQDMVKMVVFTRGFAFSAIDNNIKKLSTNHGWPTRQHPKLGSTQTKYGIQSFRPIFSDAIFKINHFGYFRDMLEQRKFAVYYDVMGVTRTGETTGRKGKRNGPVSIRFFDRDAQTFESASMSFLSGSSNRSVEATSSLPYVDGEYTNWSTVF